MRYSAGLLIHDADRPDHVLYRSPEPLLSPSTPHEQPGRRQRRRLSDGNRRSAREAARARTTSTTAWRIRVSAVPCRRRRERTREGAGERGVGQPACGWRCPRGWLRRPHGTADRGALGATLSCDCGWDCVGSLLIALRFQHAGRGSQVAAVQSTGSPSAPRPQGVDAGPARGERECALGAVGVAGVFRAGVLGAGKA